MTCFQLRGQVPLYAFVLMLMAAVGTTQPATFPLEPGESVVTCKSGFVLVGGVLVPMPYVVAVIDVRDPACNAPGFGLPTGDPSVNWLAPMYHNEAALSPTGDPAHEWTDVNLGQVFGVALDDEPNPNIYVTSTRVYGNGTAAGQVIKLDGTTGVPSVLATLPTSNTGLGNIAYDRDNQQLFVTNLDDGMIYRLDMSGTQLSTFDPFGPDDAVPGFAPLGERIWGIQVYNCRVYFGTWSEDNGTPGDPNSVWSVELDTAGEFVGPETLEVTLPDDETRNSTMPISDIAFSRDGNMMIAERGMWGDTTTAPHQSRILEYAGGHLSWAPSGATFDIGQTIGTDNSAGGVDYDCAVPDDCNLWGHVLATGDALHCCTDPNNIYGLQILPDTGGGLSNSYLIDINGNTESQDKTGLGDVEVVRTCHPPSDCNLDPGCTYTQGYWKNHHRFCKRGKRKCDPWPIDETTMLCGKTWLNILKTPPKGGNAWYILAHQWIAAKLNVASGAAADALLLQVLAEAESLLLGCSIDRDDRAWALELAQYLDDYNNGRIGPGHCDDDDDDDGYSGKHSRKHHKKGKNKGHRKGSSH